MDAVEARDHLTEARRWAKFPATMLFIVGFYWLLHVIFTRDINQIGSQSETGIGALGVFFDVALVPLGSTVVALALLYNQRWAYIPAALLPLYPLVATTVSLTGKVERKFAEYRGQGMENSFGDGIMTGLLLLALWALYLLMLNYIQRSWNLLQSGREWLSRPVKQGRAEDLPVPETSPQVDQTLEDDEYCSLFPITSSDPDTAD